MCWKYNSCTSESRCVSVFIICWLYCMNRDLVYHYSNWERGWKIRPLNSNRSE